MTSYPFYQADAFTRTPLAGNALAMFPDAQGLTDTTMQAIAREMNLSETTFVFPSEKATRRIRFFTPNAEIPLAGHPTIGTWWLLAELGHVELPDRGVERFTQETGAGVLPVDVHSEGGKPCQVVMVQAEPQFGLQVADPSELGLALGGQKDTVLRDPRPQVVSTGLPQLMIPIRSLAELELLPSGGAGGKLVDLLKQLGTDCAMCYTLETVDPKATAHCRMFAPGLGVPEDPATGSAAGALGSYLVRHDIVRPHDGVGTIAIEQGLEIGRPSRIHVQIAVGSGGEITEVRVGGEAVTVIHGEVRL
ncbi:MAG: PhzF family phenazine biosynthesis protein [Gemmatimonadota bacterium]|nr:MAG: PhzF family phenazine biosynthesis protein [Gemmatimonadota bacterium]